MARAYRPVASTLRALAIPDPVWTRTLSSRVRNQTGTTRGSRPGVTVARRPTRGRSSRKANPSCLLQAMGLVSFACDCSSMGNVRALAVRPGASGRVEQQGAEVEAAAFDGGVLVQDLGVRAAVAGQVGARVLGAGVEGGCRGHRPERAPRR